MAVALLLSVALRGAAEVQIESLRSPDGSLPMGGVGALSADGSALAGNRWSLEDFLPETFRWMAGSNVMEITPGSLPSTQPSAYVSEGLGISDNCQVVVGWRHDTEPRAFCWVDGAPVSLIATRGSMARGVSRDGTIAVGRNPTTLQATTIQAVFWSTTSGAQTVLPDLAGGATLASAEAISADKGTIVGWGTDAGGRQACRWVGGSVTPLGDLPGGRCFSEAVAVSENGGVIAGRSWSSNGLEAFRWSAAQGLQALGDLPGGCAQSEATGISDDGESIVGIAHSEVGPEIFVWTATNGMRSLRTLMKATGQDLSGWQFTGTRPRLSGDGNVLAGEGVDPDQNVAMFRVTGIRELTNCLVSTVMVWRNEGSEMVLRFSTEPFLRYQAEGAAALSGATWQPVGPVVVGTGSEQEIRCLQSAAVGCQFFRLSISK